MTLQGKSILVTGGTGFIGRRLVEKLVLEHDARVRVLVRNFTRVAGIACLPLDMRAGDMTDAAAVERAVQGCDVVFHCAYDFAATRDGQKRIGVQGTRNISEAVLRAGVSRLVHLSTFSVYGTMPDGDLTETSPWQPSTHVYTQIKRAAERVVLGLSHKKGLPVVVLQPTLVYGPFSTHWVIRPAEKLKTGLVPVVNGGQGSCNLVYIDDVVEAAIRAATHPDVLGETFLISGESPVTWKMFYDALQTVLGVHATIDMSGSEIEALLQKRARSARSLPLLVSWLRHPQVCAQLVRLPVVHTALKIIRTCLSEGGWALVKTRALQSTSQRSRQHGQSEPPLHLPDASLLALYNSHTRVCIDKAKGRLGYVPRFDFTRGMDLTARFIHWANLASVPLRKSAANRLAARH